MKIEEAFPNIDKIGIYDGGYRTGRTFDEIPTGVNADSLQVISNTILATTNDIQCKVDDLETHKVNKRLYFFTEGVLDENRVSLSVCTTWVVNWDNFTKTVEFGRITSNSIPRV